MKSKFHFHNRKFVVLKQYCKKKVESYLKRELFRFAPLRKIMSFSGVSLVGLD